MGGGDNRPDEQETDEEEYEDREPEELNTTWDDWGDEAEAEAEAGSGDETDEGSSQDEDSIVERIKSYATIGNSNADDDSNGLINRLLSSEESEQESLIPEDIDPDAQLDDFPLNDDPDNDFSSTDPTQREPDGESSTSTSTDSTDTQENTGQSELQSPTDAPSPPDSDGNVRETIQSKRPGGQSKSKSKSGSESSDTTSSTATVDDFKGDQTALRGFFGMFAISQARSGGGGSGDVDAETATNVAERLHEEARKEVGDTEE